MVYGELSVHAMVFFSEGIFQIVMYRIELKEYMAVLLD